MKTFIISLEGERGRRLESIRLIKLSGLAFEIIEAIDGRTTCDLPRSPEGWGDLRNTEVACYLSHLRALQRIVDYELPYGIILEDDFEYVVGVPRGLVEIRRELPPGFSYVCLHNLKASINPEYAVESKQPPFQKLKVAPLGAFGYIISKKLAAHVIKEHSLPSQPIDHLYVELSRDPRWNFYDLIQPIVRLRPARSTIW